MKQAVEGISDLITTPGIINVDFADVRTIMQNAGSALMGIGTGVGEQRAADAARAAISSPLLDVSIQGAKGVLFSVAGGDDLGMLEIQDAAQIVTDAIDPEAKVIFGAITDDTLKKGQIKVTVIATSFPEATARGLFTSRTVGKNDITTEKPIKKAIEHTPLPVMDEEPKMKIEEQPAIVAEPKMISADKLADDDDWANLPSFFKRK